MTARRKAGSDQQDELVFLPLGGAGEIGMNVYLYGFGPPRDRRWIMVDLGIKFGEAYEPGIDVVLPDLSFIAAERHNLEAIILTHAHEDHFGAVPYLWHELGAPVYATRFTATLLESKLEDRGIDSDVEVRTIPQGHRFQVGPFDLELVTVTHSIPEPNAVMIRTAAGSVLHSGDWKIDETPTFGPPIDEARFRAIGDEGLDALVCDSTNAVRAGISPSERVITDNLSKIIAGARGRVAVTTFASHVGRLEAVAKAGQAAGREIVIAGRAMRTVIDVARRSGYLKDGPEFHDEEAFGYLPPEKVLCLVTGSQGEARAAMARIAEDTHPNISLERGDLVVFSSKTIPGNERAVIAVHNQLAERGIRVITGDEVPVHVTGHPRRDELRAMYEWTRPRLLVPMHGEPRHLEEHAIFARECGIPVAEVIRNGQMIRLAPGQPEIFDEAPAGRLHVDGGLVVPGEGVALRTRRKLSFAGVVVASLVLGRKNEIMGEPEIMLEGVPVEDANGTPLADILLTIIEDAVERTPKPRRNEPGILEELLRRAIRRGCQEYWGKKPLCRVFVHRT